MAEARLRIVKRCPGSKSVPTSRIDVTRKRPSKASVIVSARAVITTEKAVWVTAMTGLD